MECHDPRHEMPCPDCESCEGCKECSPQHWRFKLHDVTGFARKSGTDEHGNQWIEFENDGNYLPEEYSECEICGDHIQSGWMCLDGGDEVCDKHILFWPTDQQWPEAKGD